VNHDAARVATEEVAAILERLAQRHSCRAFDGSSIERDVVDAIMRDGLEAPSSCNQQQWHFIAIDDPALKRQAQAIARGNPHFVDAGVVIYLCFQKGWTHDKFSVVQSVAGACYHMMLSAHLRGYASVWNAGIGDTREVAQMLDVPPTFEIQGALCLGRHRAGAPGIKAPRRPLQSVRSWNRFTRPERSLYPAKKAKAYPYAAITNARNPFAVWNPAAWGWDRLADFRGYAVWNKSPVAGVYAYAEQVQALSREISALPDLRAGAHLVEFMPWGGTCTALLRRHYGLNVHLHVVELSPHNHAFIFERVRQEGLSVANLHAETWIDGLPLADGSIDAAMLPRVLEHTPDPWRVLDEMRRVLKPGGVAIVSVRNRSSREAWRYCMSTTRGQVPNTGPYRLLSARRLRHELAKRFVIDDDFGMRIDDPRVHRGWRRLNAPIYVARVTRA
jgi:nitroreductase/SAM-dependent methyltransferase